MKKKILISHQSQCDKDEIKKLIDLLVKEGFDVIVGNFDKSTFDDELTDTDSYVCILDEDTHKSEEVAREVAAAVSKGISVFAIFCPSSNTEIIIPAAIDSLATGITNWDIENLCEGLKGKDIGYKNQKGEAKSITIKAKKKGCN